MTDHKYTDEEVIKALEVCSDVTTESCVGCPFLICCKQSSLKKLALDLINRQRAEIADGNAIQKMCAEVIARQDKELADLREIVFTDRTEAINNLKAEAIKEFADKLKNELTTGAAVMRVSVLNIIDYLVKEMTESKPCTEDADCSTCKYFVGCEKARGGVPCVQYTLRK